MKKILVVGVSQSWLDSEIIRKISLKTKEASFTLIVSDGKESSLFEPLGRCFYRENLAKGKYSNEDLDMKNSIPLEETVFSYMAPYVLEILTQQRRFEEYHVFHISGSYEEHYTIYMRNLFFWNSYLEQEKITHVFLSCLPHEGYDSIIYHLAKMKNIPVKMVYNATLPKRYYILSDYMDPAESLEEKYEILQEKYKSEEKIVLSEEENRIYQKWASQDPGKMKPWYMEGNPLKRRFEIRFGVTNIWNEWMYHIGRIYVKYNYKLCTRFMGECVCNIPSFMKDVINVYKRWKYARPVWKRTLELNRFYDSIAEYPVEGERYIYFAMHYQPEASSNPLGGREYSDQIFAVHLLAKSIPSGMKVYVKAHPEQLAPLRSKEYYEDIKKIPNVRILKMECSTYDLIQNAFAVSSLTGTVCWEAQFFGIPAILFGYSHKNLAPLSYHVRTLDECIKAVQSIEKSVKKSVDKELKLLLKAMYEQSFDEKAWKENVLECLEEFVKL